MRWVRDLALIMILAALAGGAVIYSRMERDQEQLVQQAAAEVRRLETEIKYRAATNAVELNARGWPVTIDPMWFDGRPPLNRLVSTDRPWLEVSGPEQAGLSHPTIRFALEPTQASFWYNPYQGIVRARVPVMVSDAKALDLYNRINACHITSLFWRETPAPTPDLAEPLPADTTPPPGTDDAVTTADQAPVTNDSGIQSAADAAGTSTAQPPPRTSHDGG